MAVWLKGTSRYAVGDIQRLEQLGMVMGIVGV